MAGGDPGGCFANPDAATANSTYFINPGSLPPIKFNIFKVGNGDLLTPGNGCIGVASQAFDVPVKHSAYWSGLYQRIQLAAASTSFEVHFTGYDTANPSMLNFDFVSISASIPSFSSVALGGGYTGVNTISICTHRTAGWGWVDTTTGVASAIVNCDLVNDSFPSSSPALIHGVIAGDFNPTATTFTLRIGGYETHAWATSTHH